MKTKGLAILIGIFLIQFISSCCKNVKYYDFSEMTYEVSNTIIEQDDILSIELLAIDLEFVASNLNKFAFSNVIAFDCDDGWGGMKHPIERIEIRSNTDFNDEFSSNKNLIDLFQIRKFIGNGEFELQPLSEQEEIQSDNLVLELHERPTISMAHSFSIKLIKSNTQEINIEIEEIIWQ